MKATFLIFAISAIFLSCDKKPEEAFYEIMNQNLIKFTDTAAYKYGRFLVAPNEKQIFNPNDTQKLLVLIDTTLQDSKSLGSSILNRHEENNLDDFKQMINDNEVSDLHHINVEKINHTGRYTLVPSPLTEKVASSYAGQIKIFKPYIKDQKAIIIFSIHSSPKSGKTNAFLLKKTDDQWIIVKDIELQRW